MQDKLTDVLLEKQKEQFDYNAKEGLSSLADEISNTSNQLLQDGSINPIDSIELSELQIEVNQGNVLKHTKEQLDNLAKVNNNNDNAKKIKIGNTPGFANTYPGLSPDGVRGENNNNRKDIAVGVASSDAVSSFGKFTEKVFPKSISERITSQLT